MSKTSKFHFFLEMIWLAVGIISVSLASYEFYTNGFDRSKSLYIIAAISFAAYFLRRYARKSKK